MQMMGAANSQAADTEAAAAIRVAALLCQQRTVAPSSVVHWSHELEASSKAHNGRNSARCACLLSTATVDNGDDG